MEVRQWIAEGRLSAQSRVKAESDAEFRALGQFPEFASALDIKKAAAPAGIAPGPDDGRDYQAALDAVKIPAILLQITAGANALWALLGAVRLLFFPQSVQEEIDKFSQNPQFQDTDGPEGIGSYDRPAGRWRLYFCVPDGAPGILGRVPNAAAAELCIRLRGGLAGDNPLRHRLLLPGIALWHLGARGSVPGASQVAVQMSLFPPAVGLSHKRAITCVMMNLVATPGLGSLIARRWVAGFGQLLLSIAGFVLIMVWFYQLVIVQFYGQMTGNVTVQPVGYIGLTGAGIFAAAWLWSLGTSILLMQDVSRVSAGSLKLFGASLIKLDEQSIAAALAWPCRTGTARAR